jgi:hypothetical protein
VYGANNNARALLLRDQRGAAVARKSICGWGGGEGRDVSSALGSDEAGDGDMDKATHADIARAYEA